MSFITDKNIHLYYTQSYRKKMSEKGGATPTYFSLIDSEVNYNLVNADDGIVDNNGFENNSVTADLDIKIFDLPVLEPTEDMTDLRSAMYGYWDLGAVPNMESIGFELTENESEYTRVKKYTLSTTYSQIPDQQLINDRSIVQVNSGVFGIYRDYFNLQAANDFSLYNEGVVEDNIAILESLSAGTQDNTYALYRDFVPNRNAAQKQLSEQKIRAIGGRLNPNTRGYLRMSNPAYFPSHKMFLHLYADNAYSIIDVTGEDMTSSIPYPVNPLYIAQVLNSEDLPSLQLTVWFESMFKVFLNNQFVLFRSQTEKIQLELLLQ